MATLYKPERPQIQEDLSQVYKIVATACLSKRMPWRTKITDIFKNTHRAHDATA